MSGASRGRGLPVLGEGAPRVPDGSEAWDAGATLYSVVTVRVGEGGELMDVDAGDELYRRGEVVTIERDGGRELGVVVAPARRVMATGSLPRALRRTSDDDVRQEAALRRREQQVFAQARAVVRELGLPMKIVRVSVAKGAHRVTLFYAAETRVDCRELLRRLGPLVQARLELRQLGMRDAAQLIGGVGPCGLQLCCSTFLKDFAPVSIKMAKDQGLALSPQRVSGVCGRLLCCLVYEEAFYRQQREGLPRVGRRVMTPEGPGKVRDVDVLNSKIVVWLDAGRLTTVASDQVRRVQG
jgi:cell fate regulator YaaT (PSP1 superfamily)